MKKIICLGSIILSLFVFISCSKSLPDNGVNVLNTAITGLVTKKPKAFLDQVIPAQQKYAYTFMSKQHPGFFLMPEKYKVVDSTLESDEKGYAHVQLFYPKSGKETLSIATLWLCFKKVKDAWKIDFKETVAKMKRINGSSAFTGITFTK